MNFWKSRNLTIIYFSTSFFHKYSKIMNFFTNPSLLTTSYTQLIANTRSYHSSLLKHHGILIQLLALKTPNFRKFDVKYFKIVESFFNRQFFNILFFLQIIKIPYFFIINLFEILNLLNS